MEPKYHIAMKSIAGTRDEQQDSSFYHADKNYVFAVICDGMGGMDEGHIASFMTVEKIKSLYFAKNEFEDYPSFFLRIVDILDENVMFLKNCDGKRISSGTTIVTAAIEDDKLFWLSVGDSRLYLIRNNEIVQVTRDHNYFMDLNKLKKDNKINQNQYETESKKGDALISFIGMGGIQIMDINKQPFRLIKGDTVLLTSDGLYKALTNEEILILLKNDNIEISANNLMEKSVEKSMIFQDNTTFIVIRYF